MTNLLETALKKISELPKEEGLTVLNPYGDIFVGT